MKDNHTLLIIITAMAISITLYSVAELAYDLTAIAFKPGDNLSTTLNQSSDINESTFSTSSSVNATESSFLKVIMLANNAGGAGAKPSDFHISIQEKSGSFLMEAYDKAHPSSFSGSANGTISTIIPGTYTVRVGDVINDVTYSLKFSGKCVGYALDKSEVVIKPGDKVTCTVTATNVNF